MSTDQLVFYSSWASIIALILALVSILAVRTVKANIIKYRRKERIHRLVDELLDICRNNQPLLPRYHGKVNSLKRNLHIYPWYKFTSKGKATIALHQLLDDGDCAMLIEALADLQSHWEDL